MQLPAEIYSVASVRSIDQAAIDEAGIDACTLMKRAGEFAFDTIVRDFPDAGNWQVICGGGNNGGDGYVVARLAREQGIDVSVIAMCVPESLRGAAAEAFRDYRSGGGDVQELSGAIDPQADILVDALLGNGLDRAVSGDFADIINEMNQHPAPVIALDIPSGLDGDTGNVLGCAVKADTTITFVGLKKGLFIGDAPDHVGRLALTELDIPEFCRQSQKPSLRRLDMEVVAAALPPRRRSAHKGDFGRILVVAGGPGMPGAARICGEAALRAGAGAVTIATDPRHAASITASRPELMACGVASANELEPLINAADVLAIGPGLGMSDWSQCLFAAALESGKTLVIDADALNLLAGQPHASERWILTPHPGEAARLLDTSVAKIQADRLAALHELSARYGGTIVLKGSGTLVSASDGIPQLCTAGNPGMAAPGMGDALTGIVAAFLGQGLSPASAAAVGVQVHAMAGDSAAVNGERGMLTSDLLAEIRAWVNS